MHFIFDEFETDVYISKEIPVIQEIAHGLGADANSSSFKPLFVVDENTEYAAKKICESRNFPCCVLKSGEEYKNWQTAETIIEAAIKAGLDRDGVFIAAGGGVICDVTAFAASVYKRGCGLVLVPTTLLCMVDASVGGKTGFDHSGMKNLVGSFYPAKAVYIPVEVLSTLPKKEWKNGMAEIIKTAILSGDDFLEQLTVYKEQLTKNSEQITVIKDFIERSVTFKGGIVSEDLRESENGKRKLLNLGHTFGHALESAAGLGNVSHGEAVAWGIIRACELGCELGITTALRAEKIRDVIASFGYETSVPHPLAPDAGALFNAMKNDKKKLGGKMTFIVPDEKSACPVMIESETELELLKNILNGSKKC